MKNILLTGYCLILFLPLTSFCQKTHLSIGSDIAFPGPSSGLSLNAKTGYGGSLGIETVFSNHFTGILTGGHLQFASAQPYSDENTTTKVSATIVQAGIKYYIQQLASAPNGFFLSAELGVMHTKTHFTFPSLPERTNKESGLSVAPGIGYVYKRIEFNFKPQYNLLASGFNTYYYSFRVAYAFLKF